MKKNQNILAGITAVLMISVAGTSWGEEKVQSPMKKKSMTAAVILGIDPIPGDALIYAGKGGQGGANIALAVGGVGIIFVGLVAGLASGLCETCTSEEHESGETTALILVSSGLGMYVGSLIWDGIGGISGVKEHNKKVDQQPSIVSSLRPIISASDKGGLIGVQFSF